MMMPERDGVRIYWIPLGAGGVGFVRLNGRIYEAIHARRERRTPTDLYHTALEVFVSGSRFTIENAWPSPDGDIASRGVVLEGPVFSRKLHRLRPFRYEVRMWRDGIIPDAEHAVGGPETVCREIAGARKLLETVPSLPAMVWGRDDLGAGEMWNSNSVVSWLLARSGLPAAELRPPGDGRAPGWHAGLVAADAHPHDLSLDPSPG